MLCTEICEVYIRNLYVILTQIESSQKESHRWDHLKKLHNGYEKCYNSKNITKKRSKKL